MQAGHAQAKLGLARVTKLAVPQFWTIRSGELCWARTLAGASLFEELAFGNSNVRIGSATRFDGAKQMLQRARKILESTIDNYIASDSLTRGAAIAFYSVTSLIPVLIIVIAIAGLAFGEGAARGAIVGELASLIGVESAKLIQSAIENAYISGANGFALIVGATILALTVSGVFGELQAALNAIWKVDDRGFSLSRLMRGRAVSIGLVIGLGFLLLVSLVIDAGVNATSGYINLHFRYGGAMLSALSTAASFVLTWTLFAAIYKVLPDKPLDWR